jgi:hypothetical protein
MKIMFILATAFVLSSEWADAQTTGRGALTALTREKGAQIASQVVLVSGSQGQDQPAAWRVIARDPEFAGRFREYTIQKGRVVQAGPLPAQEAGNLSRAPIVSKRIKVDSTMAFAAADRAAKEALVGFDSLDYELRNKELSQDPVWVVRLTDANGAAAGELIISAESGVVLRKTWYETGRRQPESTATLAAKPQGTGSVGQPTANAFGQTAQHLWDGTRHGIEQGKEVVKTGFQRAGTSVRGWFDRLRGEESTNNSGAWEDGVYDSSNR